MLSAIWNGGLVNPLLNILLYLYNLTGSLGFSIISLTIIIRALLIPFIMPSMETMKKQRDLQPELDKIKKKFKYDKKKQAEMQMELFKKHGINPASGCLNQIVMILVLIALFSVIRLMTLNGDAGNINERIYFDSLKLASEQTVDTSFGYMDLSKPDPYFVLAVMAGAFQFVVSKMSMPYTKEGEKAAKKTPEKTDDFAYAMQEQTLYIMPFMNFLISVTLPSGVVLYIVTTTIFSMIQTYFVMGLGGLKPWVNKFIPARN